MVVVVVIGVVVVIVVVFVVVVVVTCGISCRFRAHTPEKENKTLTL